MRVADVVSALSQALDLGSGSGEWHSVRTCILGMRIADELQLPEHIRCELYYALVLKDVGCSSNASELYHALHADEISAKHDSKLIDWTRPSLETLAYLVRHAGAGKSFGERWAAILKLALRRKSHGRSVTALRCERGATLTRLMGLDEGTASGIAGLDEHWDGSGYPAGLVRLDIPLASRIMLLAQTLDMFLTSLSPEAALDVVTERSGHWFDPDLVKVVRSLASRHVLWSGLCQGRDREIALRMEPCVRTMAEGHVTLDRICQAFANVVDAKSPFTYNHSNGVANAAVAIAKQLNFSSDRTLFVRHASLLHDIGKMAVSNAILEKLGPLDDDEWKSMRAHAEFTFSILRSVRGLEEMSGVAASHHERLDGSGYFRGLRGDQISLETRLLAVADVFDALSANRPYRDAMPAEKIFGLLRAEAPYALDPTCVEALERSGISCDQSYHDLSSLQQQLQPWSSHATAAGAF